MKIDTDKDIYATVQPVEAKHGYAHIHVFIHNTSPSMFSSEGVRIEATCQIGSANGDIGNKSYAHRWGASAYTSDSMNLIQLEKAVKVMRKIERKMNDFYDDLGSPLDFSEFAARVIKAAGAKTVHFYNPGGAFSGCFEFDTRHDSVVSVAYNGISEVRKRISVMEKDLIQKNCPQAA